MAADELAQLKLLSQVDALVDRLREWSHRSSAWEPVREVQSVLRRVLSRVDPVRMRLDAPLVVATFGGTGVGKSTLINALVGEDVTAAGRQRPTTRQPVLIAHRETSIDGYGFPLDEMRVVRSEAPLLRELLLVDCPDPDTTDLADVEHPESNLAQLRAILPSCDVLLCVSTQQKYRSAKVGDELRQAAEGCRLIFVQTHADQDTDIREDWRQQLAEDYRIADLFFVDSRMATAEQQRGVRPSGEFGRLLDVLFRELSAAQRIRIRRGNVFGLVHAALERGCDDLSRHQPAVHGLRQRIDDRERQLTAQLSQQLQDELLVSRGLWERRLFETVTQLWGLSPFSALLRLYASQASLIASWTLLRAQSTAQLALWGAVQTTRWWQNRQQHATDEQRWQAATGAALSGAHWQELQWELAGDVRVAKLDRDVADAALAEAPRTVAVSEEQFWGMARTRLDELILQAGRRCTGWFTRVTYEIGFAVLPTFLLYRVGKNFFYESYWLNQPLLESQFYIPAGLFLVMWAGLWLSLFSWRMRRGVRQQIRTLATDLAQTRLGAGLLPQISEQCREFERETQALVDLAELVTDVREQISTGEALSSARSGSRSTVSRPHTPPAKVGASGG
jgi:hypothetical protein